MSAYIKFGEILLICYKILIGNEILTPIKAHNSVTNLRKSMRYNRNLDLVNINACTKFGKILPVCSQNIERKLNSERNSDIKQGP